MSHDLTQVWQANTHPSGFKYEKQRYKVKNRLMGGVYLIIEYEE